MTVSQHQPVMLAEVMIWLNVEEDGFYVDCTYGRGGHCQEILSRMGPEGRLLVLDQDEDAVDHARSHYGDDHRFSVTHASFSSLTDAVRDRGWMGKVRGVLIDLGVSLDQLRDAGRGFSWELDAVVDMRMDKRSTMSAAAWLRNVPERELADVLFHYGGERYARRIARAIVRERRSGTDFRTKELARIISGKIPHRGPSRIHPATKSFQAIRIHVNGELDELRAVLPQVSDVLAPGGRLLAISFHSLEDGIVKHFLRGDETALSPVNGLIRPSEAECKNNPRARSARMRVAELAA